MKKFIRPISILLISLLLALFSVAFTHSNYVESGEPSSNSGVALFFQTTSTPHAKADTSEVGSTDGITIMSFVIVALIVIPIYLQRRHWSQT